MENDIVLDLKENPFERRNIAEKREIIRSGRPTPPLKTKVGTRSFQMKWYEQIDWLCASASNEKLYCWPCLLFQPKSNQSWTDGGYSNYKNILSDCKYHCKSLSHLNSYKCLKTFGKCDVITVVSESEKIERERHNRLVEENRQYLKQLTNALLYLCKQELPLHGHDERTYNYNKGNFRELLHCFAEIDSVFASRLSTKEGSEHFSGVSNTIQNDIISATNNVIADVIRTEVESVPFISVQADETTDCAMNARLSIIIRYVSKYKINERFLGFYDISDDKSALNLCDVIETALKPFSEAKSKLVSQTHDGAAVMAGELNGVKTKLKEKGFKHTHFIHCYTHNLNVVLSKSAEKVDGVKMFFSHLHSFNKFASSSFKRESVFKDFNISMPSLYEIRRYCYRCRTVSSIKRKLGNLKSAFQNILDNSGTWDEATLSETDNLLAKLTDFTFMFFINCFYNILSKAERLFDLDELQCKQVYWKLAQEKLSDFIQYVEIHSNDEYYEYIVQETMTDIEQPDNLEPPPKKRVRGKEFNYKTMYFEVIDNILLALRERLTCFQEFAFIELLDVDRFAGFAHTFPVHHVDALQNKYPNIFDYKSLVSELKYMYNDSDFKKCKSGNAILELLHKLGLLSAMSESIKLFQLLLTIPVTSVAKEREFSALDRIRSYLQCTKAQEQLSFLASISIEKEILEDLESKRELHNKILQEFAIKSRRLEFIFI